MKEFLRCLFVILISGCTSQVQGKCPYNGKDSGHFVYLVSHGWHTGIVIKKEEIMGELAPVVAQFPSARYLEFGWGDAEFYQDRESSTALALRAGLCPTSSVIQVVGFSDKVESYFSESEIVQISMSKDAQEALALFISVHFLRDEENNIQDLGPSLYGHGRFFASSGSFHLFRTCNTWTAEALQASGCPVRVVCTYSADSVTKQAKRFGKVIR